MSVKDPPLSSRKFLAFLVAEVTWKVILMVILVLEMNKGDLSLTMGILCVSMIIIIGFMEALYIGGQAALDKYTQVAQIAVQSGQTFNIKGMEISGQPPLPPKPEPKPPEG